MRSKTIRYSKALLNAPDIYSIGSRYATSGKTIWIMKNDRTLFLYKGCHFIYLHSGKLTFEVDQKKYSIDITNVDCYIV